MMKKAVFAIVAIAMMATMLIPAHAWIYPNCSSDAEFEQYGPRADRLLIHLYGSDTAEFAAMRAGEIDLEDWPLSKAEYLVETSPPYNATIKVVNYGPEYGLYILDMNNNNNTYLGNPPDVGNGVNPADVKVLNPSNGVKYNWMADVWLRRALGYLVDRNSYIADPSIGAGFGYPLYTVIPPPQAKYLLNIYGNGTAPWAWTYSRASCNATLDAHGYAIGSSGYREYRGQVVKLQFWIRNDHAGRNHIGQVLVAEMTACGFYMHENVHFANSGDCHVAVMTNKDFHLYTGGWSLSAQPDFLILWDWAYYWHPGDCYDYGGCNDPAFNDAAEGIMYANTQAEAVAMALTAQWRMAYLALSIPIYCVSGNKAYYKTNTNNVDNPLDTTVGQTWYGVVNIMGYGIDNGWSFMDMHTDVTESGGGMTIDYGFKVPELKQPNIIYASWLYDTNYLGQMYESLLASNASNLAQILPWMASDYSVGTYEHPVLGTCSSVKFTLRSDLNWSDGYPITLADVYFSMVEIKKDLSARHYPNPWWWSNVQDILSFTQLDPYNFEVLLDVKSYWALYWIGGTYILPKHVWKPIVLTADPTTTCPDTNFIASGPWKSKYSWYVPSSHILLVANPYFHNIDPDSFTMRFCQDDNLKKFPPARALNPPTFTVDNRDERESKTNVNVAITVVYPDGSIGTFNFGPYVLPPSSSLTVGIVGFWKTNPPAAGRYDVSAVESATLRGVVRTKHWKDPMYLTIPEDIAGSTYYEDIGWTSYPYKNELPTPDLVVDTSDLARASSAFGSYPGHPKWQAIADITGDYTVDIEDVARISKKFGWHA